MSIVAAESFLNSSGLVNMKSTYSITLEGILPVIAKLHISANSESEAIILAERIAESQRSGVKTAVLKIEAYPADWLMVEGVGEITAVEPEDANGKVWKREEIGRAACRGR